VDGRVVDDLGAPLADFTVVADRGEDMSRVLDGHNLVRSFRDTDGTFHMDGFAPGQWKLRGRSKSHSESEPVSVTLPDGRPGVLVVPRAARVSGRVLDPGCAPVAGAEVELVNERGPGSFFDVQSARSDEQGNFEFEAHRPGEIVLWASAPNF